MSEILGSNSQVVDSQNDIVPVREETTQKLVVLRQDVGPLNPVVPEKAPESNESKPAFDRVFEGARSEVFTQENREVLGKLIDGAFDTETLKKLTPVQRENIRLAMTNRLLKDPKIQGLFDMKIGLVDMLGHMAKGEVREAMDTDKAKESAGQLDRIMQVFHDQVKVAAKPLVELLNSNKPATSILLSNPRAIAEYNGGEIAPDITQMNQSDLNQYITSLNGDVRKIDNKIFPMEEIKERGMNFVANGPDILVRFFKWLISFDIIANLLGYKGTQAEREAMFDDERRERRSLNILREFGRVTDMEGKEKDGEYTGKIDILKGKDLSGIKRKKLKDFFTFTRSEGINTETPEFWMGLFNDGKIMKKGSKGKNEAGEEVEVKDQEYLVDKIEEKDFERNFEGLYEKLNSLHNKNENRKYKEQQEVEKQKQEADEKSKQEVTAKQAAEIERVAKEVEPLKNLVAGLVINAKTVEILKDITVQDFVDGQFIGKANKLLGDNPNKEAIIKVLGTYSGLLSSNEKVKTYVTNLKTTMNGPVTFWTLSYQRRNMLIAAGFTGEWMKSQEVKNPETAKVEPVSTQPVQKPAEDQKDPKVLIVEAFNKATEFPFQFLDKQVNFENELLCIGDRKFSLKGSNKYLPLVNITKVSFIGVNMELEHVWDPSLVLRSEIATGLPRMLEMEKDTTIEAKGKDGKIIITRVA